MPGLALTSRPTAAGARLVDPRVLDRFGFTDHALARFAERAGIHGDLRLDIQPILRDLLLTEGTWTGQASNWARSSKPADTYLQIGTWMCLLARADTYCGRGHYSIVTVVNGPDRNDWATALKRGYIHLPPPPPRFRDSRPRVTWRDSFRIARQRPDASIGTLRLFLQVHRDRCTEAGDAYARAHARHARMLKDYRQARTSARAVHLQRSTIARRLLPSPWLAQIVERGPVRRGVERAPGFRG